MVPAAGRPTEPIVWDLEEGVKQWGPWGWNIPWYRPEKCPRCGAAGTLVGHGLRMRKKTAVAVRRLRCGRWRRPGACGKTVTVIPSFLYPRYWYGLHHIQPVLLGRFGQTPPKSWRELARSHPASNRTLSRWCASFSADAGRWASGVVAAFSEVRGEFAIPPSASDHHERLTLSVGGLFLDWREHSQTGKQLNQDQLLQRLWGWGARSLKIPLFSSTTFVEGLRRGREPKRGPPIP